jgi:hypothetical protein
MNNLKQPNKGDKAKAADIRAMVVSIIRNNVTAGLGLSEQNTPNGKIISLKQQPRARASTASENPRSFDLAPGSAGKLKLVRCYYQIQDVYRLASDTEEFTPAAGNLCAVINTSDNTVSAQMDFVYSKLTPELIPVRVYVIDASGGIVCDCRGSQVVIYG